MKTICLFLTLVAVLGRPLGRAADPITDAFQKALFEEEANQNLDAAIKAYQSVIDATDAQRRLSATAVFRLGECYRKLGQTNDAVAQYQRLLRDYADQTNLVTLSQQNLAGLGLMAETTPPPSLSRAARQEEKRLLEQEIKLAEDQLAVVKAQFQAGVTSQAEVNNQERDVLALKRQLVALDVGPATASEGTTAEAGATDEEDKEIRRIQALIQNSPDLISGAGTGGGPTPLMLAAQRGHLAVARFLLAANADVNAQPGGATALYYAVNAGQKTMAELLLTNGARVNVQDINGSSLLYTAVQKGYRAVAEVLLDHKADVNLKDKRGRTPLFEAAEAGQVELAELLLRRGADVHAQDENGLTALHGAASKGRDAVVALLLKWKAEVDGRNKSITPLVFAVEGGQVTTADLLVKAGADTNVKAYKGTRTLLHLAIRSGKPDILKLLLAHKPDLETVDSAGYTPLQWAVSGFYMSSVLAGKRYVFNDASVAESVQLLLEAGANANRPYRLTDNRNILDDRPGYPSLDSTGCTPLVVASFLGQTATMKSLLAHGAEVNAKSSDGMTSLLYATKRKSLPMIEAILGYKPDFELRDREGYTALIWAIAFRETGLAEKLIQAGADVNADGPPRFYGPGGIPTEGKFYTGTILDYAVVNGNKELVELLLTNKAKINVVNQRGQTPLGLAQAFARDSGSQGRVNYEAITALLLTHGADENFTRRTYIAVARRDGSLYYSPFDRGTNDWNRYTLLELIATVFAVPDQPPASQLGFPDLSRVTIRRLGARGEPDRRLNVDVATVLNSGDCTNVPWLEWGDIVDIPEHDHPVSEQWQGLSRAVREVLTKCLQREVSVVIKGETRKVVLRPALGVGTPGPSGPVPPGVFRLNEVLRWSGLARVSSDLVRVHVKRTDPTTHKAVEWIVDLGSSQPYDARTDLWLRDGDVIEVPEK